VLQTPVPLLHCLVAEKNYFSAPLSSLVQLNLPETFHAPSSWAKMWSQMSAFNVVLSKVMMVFASMMQK